MNLKTFGLIAKRDLIISVVVVGRTMAFVVGEAFPWHRQCRFQGWHRQDSVKATKSVLRGQALP